MSDRGDAWEATWAFLSLGLGEVVSALTVYPVLGDIPFVSQVIFTFGFGFFLAATFFLMGLPFVSAIKSLILYIGRWIHGCFSKRTKES